jgi:hypothetical protein
VRNKLEYTEEFDNAVWNKTNSTVTPSVLDPDGNDTAWTLAATAANGQILISIGGSLGTGQSYTGSIWMRRRTGSGAVSMFNPNGGGISAKAITTSWQRFDTTGLGAASTNFFGVRLGTSGDAIDIWHPQLEVGSTATNYQRVGSFLDVSEEGKPRRGRLWYNGTSHFMQTPTITPGTDKVQVFAGVRKLSDAAAILVESSTSLSNNGTFYFVAGEDRTARYSSLSKGSAPAGLTVNARWTDGGFAPDTAVLTTTHDIAGDLSRIRRNGVFGVDATGDKGTGNYLAYALYFGARAGTSFFFNGYEDTSIIRFGPNLDDTTISKVESYVASKTPEPTL